MKHNIDNLTLFLELLVKFASPFWNGIRSAFATSSRDGIASVADNGIHCGWPFLQQMMASLLQQWILPILPTYLNTIGPILTMVCLNESFRCEAVDLCAVWQGFHSTQSIAPAFAFRRTWTRWTHCGADIAKNVPCDNGWSTRRGDCQSWARQTKVQAPAKEQAQKSACLVLSQFP